MVYRVYVEKKPGFDGEVKSLAQELTELVGIKDLKNLRLLNRYDVEGVSRELFDSCVPTVFSEPPVDNVYKHCPKADTIFAVEFLPGQFDQRADSASECIQLISQGERPTVRTARVYLLDGELTAEELEAIKKYVINPVEAREAPLDQKTTLTVDYPKPAAVAILDGFREMDEQDLADMITH
ncbi:phosphoribosylformylglycinamidine synthase, partial [gut metagenome]